MLGENSTAFAANGNKVVSFDIASGTVNWTWQAPSGRADMVAATAGNGLVAKAFAFNNLGQQIAQIVRLDSNGQATFDTWTTIPPSSSTTVDPAKIASVDYNLGDQWVGITYPSSGSDPEVGISAAANLWPGSVWSRPTQGGPRGPDPVISVQLYKVRDTATDGVVLDEMIQAANFWQEKANILLHWIPTITDVDSCDAAAHPFDCGVNETFDITSIPTTPLPGQQVNPTVAEVYRRFCSDLNNLQPFCKPKGSQLLFTHFVDGKTGQGGTPRIGGVQINLSFFGLDAAGLTAAHEFGHQFQLEHCILCGTGNLMFSFPVISGSTPGSGLFPSQISKARVGARKWSQ